MPDVAPEGVVASYRQEAAKTRAAATAMKASVEGRGLRAKERALRAEAAATAAHGSEPVKAAAAMPRSQAKARAPRITGRRRRPACPPPQAPRSFRTRTRAPAPAPAARRRWRRARPPDASGRYRRPRPPPPPAI